VTDPTSAGPPGSCPACRPKRFRPAPDPRAHRRLRPLATCAARVAVFVLEEHSSGLPLAVAGTYTRLFGEPHQLLARKE
jgi:hypothetical protein